MRGRPTGTVTFLFTDIEASTRLIQHLGDEGYAHVLAEHNQLLRGAFTSGGGYEIETQGDGFLVAFQSARDAISTALAAQQALDGHRWPDGIALRVRMGLHTGEPAAGGAAYVGLDVHRAARICGAGWGGQILISMPTRDLLGDALPPGGSLRDLGDHRLKDLQRPERVFQFVHPGLRSDFPPLRSLGSLPNNLPVQLTSFIRREREMAEVKTRLASARLLTLTGSGGCGKTRLALHVAADMLEEYPGGIWLVELAALSDPALVPQKVASALGLREEPGRALVATLVDYLSPRKPLLILDNCEHLVAACAQLAEALLRACSDLHILTTSQHPLRIAGEETYRVPSLSLPDFNKLPPPETLTQFGAVQLFVERARSNLPAFTMTPQNAPAVARICHRLDGIPLAVELAAARVKVLSVEQILARLDDRFQLLTGGGRTVLPRHQTLRAAMDWSHELLEDAERMLLARLSVFAGSFTLEAAEAICGWEGIQEFEVLGLLSQLVDKSLVVAEDQNGEIRYRLLETIRQYSGRNLRAAGQDTALRARHRDWYQGFAEQAERELRGPEQERWFKRLDVDHDNLRAALDWCVENGDAEEALRLAGALWRFWLVRSLSEGRRRMEAALSVRGETSLRSRAKVLNGLGLIALEQGDVEPARRFLEESLAIDRQLNDRQSIAASLNNLGNVAQSQGDYALARSLHEEALGIRRELGERRGIASSLNNLGIVARAQGDYASATACYEESLALKRAEGDRRGIALSLNNLGNIATIQGDYALARSRHEEALTTRRALGDKRGIASSLNNLGILARFEGKYAHARSLHEEALLLLREVGVKSVIADNFDGLARVAVAENQLERAARFFGAMEGLREAAGIPLPSSERADYDRVVAEARAAAGEDAFETARAEGRKMTLDQALAYALTAGQIEPGSPTGRR